MFVVVVVARLYTQKCVSLINLRVRLSRLWVWLTDLSAVHKHTSVIKRYRGQNSLVCMCHYNLSGWPLRVQIPHSDCPTDVARKQESPWRMPRGATG